MASAAALHRPSSSPATLGGGGLFRGQRQRPAGPQKVVQHANGSKDWEVAANLRSRTERYEARQTQRNRSWSGFVGRPTPDGPLIRGPVHEPNKGRSSYDDGWYNKLANAAFVSFDTAKLGQVSMKDLHHSFIGLNMPVDAGTFQRYLQAASLPQADAVDKKDFVRLHRIVWENQPPAVKRHVALSALAPKGRQGSTGRSLSSGALVGRSADVPVREILEGERVARRAFHRHGEADKCGGAVKAVALPKVFSDLGLDPDSTEEVAKATGDGRRQFSFEEFVSVMNKHMHSAEGFRDIAPEARAFKGSMRKLLEAQSFAATASLSASSNEDEHAEDNGLLPENEVAASKQTEQDAAAFERSLKAKSRAALAAAMLGPARSGEIAAPEVAAVDVTSQAVEGPGIAPIVVKLVLEGASRILSFSEMTA